LLPDDESGSLINRPTTIILFYVKVRSFRATGFPARTASGRTIGVIDRALADKERGLGNHKVKIDKDAHGT
jgi:hypothetical protein